jgi:hypothetical protein
MGKRFAIVASPTRGRSATWISSIALVVMVLCAAWLAAAPQAAEARGAQKCGDTPKYDYFDLRAHNVGCDYARRVARHHTKTGDRRFDGWKCDDDRFEPQTRRATCRRNDEGEIQRIRYIFRI